MGADLRDTPRTLGDDDEVAAHNELAGRVVVVESDSRNRVVSSSTEGNDENATGEETYRATITRTTAALMLVAMSMSTSGVGMGSTIMAMVIITSPASITSLRRVAASIYGTPLEKLIKSSRSRRRVARRRAAWRPRLKPYGLRRFRGYRAPVLARLV